jgi:hypothetical protein
VSRKLRHALAAQASFCVLFLLGRTAAWAGAKAQPEEAARIGASARVYPQYSSNLYREQRRRESDFGQNAPGERYFEMEGPADVATETGLAGSYEWPVGKKRDASLEVDGEYVFHLRNAIANYFHFNAGVGVDVTSKDAVSLRAGLTPHRFKKNYAVREFAGNKFYEHAYYSEVEGWLAWRHHFKKRLKAELGYEPSLRRFLDPFGNRDTFRNAGELSAGYDFGKVEPEIGLGAAIARTPSGLEFGVPVDRSYRDVRPFASLKVSLGHGFLLGADVEYRNRHYTTTEPANETYYGRTDWRWAFGVNGRERLGSVVMLFAEAEFLENSTNRKDHPDLDPEDLGYEELTVSLGVEVTL